MRLYRLEVRIDGRTHREWSDASVLHSAEVVQQLNDHWYAAIELRQPLDARFPAEQCLGKPLLVSAFDEEGQERKLFEGLVLESELTYEPAGYYRTTLSGVTKSYRLSLATRHAYYRKQTLPQIAEQIVGGEGLSFELRHEGELRQLNYVQWGESDFDFLHRLADDHACWLRPAADGLEVQGAFQKGVTLGWRQGDQLQQFTVSGRLQPPSFSGVAYDVRARQLAAFEDVRQEPAFFSGSSAMVDAAKVASEGNLGSGSMALESRAPSPDEFRQRLEHESLRATSAVVTAYGSSRDPEVTAGDTVTIEGVLDAEGSYGVLKAVHRWTRKGYENQFWATPAQVYLSPARPQAKRITGAVPATVIEHNDPRRLGRIQVRYLWQAEGATGWARMVFPHAGAGRGFVFMPEKGDEVLVAFEDGDPERPYILGALFNGVNQQPKAGFRNPAVQDKDGAANDDFADNHIKRLVTRSGAGLHMNDKPGQEALSLNVPGNMRFLMTHDNPQHPGRNLVMLLAEEGDIVLSAPNGRIHLHSKYQSREVMGE